jgi:hypothetical protein
MRKKGLSKQILILVLALIIISILFSFIFSAKKQPQKDIKEVLQNKCTADKEFLDKAGCLDYELTIKAINESDERYCNFINNPQKKEDCKAKLRLKGEVELCLEKKEFDERCQFVFINPEIEEICKKLGDNCFYKLSEITRREELCNRIENENMKTKCKREIPPIYQYNAYTGEVYEYG